MEKNKKTCVICGREFFSPLPAKMLLGARPTLPDGWEPIGKYAVRTDDWTMGVLVQNKQTGIYRLFSRGTIMSVDQIAAKEYKEPED